MTKLQRKREQWAQLYDRLSPDGKSQFAIRDRRVNRKIDMRKGRSKQ